ncbi:MAG: tRNA glutamyl-Q(34) synthetase GluQRS [Gammaproteobacteria bacterium]|nr:tRNA glutamyl-Q(34) synthetase GluQRS [Gammaproteobacteria bacterium]
MSTSTPPYRGRFAPSPTGPLHLGSLLAALASWLDARAGGGQWLVRIEDLDPPRVVPGASDAMLRTLEAAGLCWDESVWYQSARTEAYDEALHQLAGTGTLYSCRCSRREIADSALTGIEGPVYPGTCRARPADLAAAFALRVGTSATPIAFTDRLCGVIAHCLERDTGDFVVRRADGIAAYQLAVVVDDAAQGITDIVRGADLLASTTRQIHLQRLLDVPTPRYAHLPVLVDAAGDKLSKQTGARGIGPAEVGPALRQVLALLGLPAPPEDLPPREIPAWAVRHWRIDRIPRGLLRAEESRPVPTPSDQRMP